MTKLYRQFAKPYGYCKNVTVKLDKVVKDVIAKAEENGKLLTSDEVMAVNKMEEQKVLNQAVAQALIKCDDKKWFNELQTSLTSMYTLGDNQYPDIVKK